MKPPPEPGNPVPTFMAGHADAYATDPRAACLEWFRQARYGLFVHYGPYSLLGRHEWVMLREKIPVAEYTRFADRFTADRFDADAVARLAVDAGMKYVNITTRHHDSFSLFDTKQVIPGDEKPFSSVTAPCGRDLVKELADACEKHALGLCLYVSHGREWRHPHGPNNDTHAGHARPEYDPPEPRYAVGRDHDLDLYLDFVKAQVTELLTNYGPIAAIWLDGIMVPLSDRRRSPCPMPPNQRGNAPEWRCQQLYDHIHALQPHTLVSYKQGLLGTEDFVAPEFDAVDTQGRPGEICATMTERPIRSWGWLEAADNPEGHRSEAEVWATLRDARSRGFNLLLNTAPRPDGGLDPYDTDVLRRVGERLRIEGFPGEGDSTSVVL